MNELAVTAPAFVERAHRIIGCSFATVDRRGRPRSRIVHPVWEWDGEALVGWVGSIVTPMKAAHLEATPFASCSYFGPESRDDCVAECRATLLTDDATREEIWNKIKSLPPPLGYDPAEIPQWAEGRTSPLWGVIRLDPWRLKVFPGVFALTSGAEGEILTWRE